MLQLSYLQIERKFTARNKTILFILAKVAAKRQLVTLLFQRARVKILLAKGKIKSQMQLY